MKITKGKVLGIFLLGLAAFILPTSGWYYICAAILVHRGCYLIWGGIPLAVMQGGRR